MILEAELKTVGLKESEVKVYLYLLANGLASPPQIAKGTGIARSNCYVILNGLRVRGLITEQSKGKRKAYLANDPSALIHSMQQRTDALQQLLPDLRSLYVAQKNKPSIKFFDGAEQAKEIFYEMLEAKEVMGVASTKKLFAVMGTDFFGPYIKQMQERGIKLRDILTKESVDTSAKTAVSLLRHLYEYRMLPESTGDIPVDILSWDDKVAFLSVDAPVFGTLIKNKAIADMMKIMFELSWKQLGPARS